MLSFAKLRLRVLRIGNDLHANLMKTLAPPGG